MTATNYYCACGSAFVEAFYHDEWTGWRCMGCGKTDAYNPPRSAVSKWEYTPPRAPAIRVLPSSSPTLNLRGSQQRETGDEGLGDRV